MIFSTESPDWTIIHKEKSVIQAELIKNEIESNEIPCYIINRKDSSYPIFGNYILYVPKDRAEVAKVIVSVFLDNNDD
jgi:hypothetical protein